MTRQATGRSSNNSTHTFLAAAGNPSRAQGRPGATCRYYNGFKYTRGYGSKVKITFRCSVYRRTTNCKALLEVYAAGGVAQVNDHTCVPALIEETNTLDVTSQMKQMVDTLCIMDLAKTVGDIWNAVSSKYYPADGVIRKGLTEDQVSSRIYRMRRKHYGSHLLGMIEVSPLSMVEGKPLSFFQFHVSRPNEDPTGKPHRIIGWAHPELRQLLMYHNVTIFIDGTFRIVPKGFKQCVIVMVNDRASELNVPVYYVQCTGKSLDMYFNILELIFRDTSENLAPSEIVCDFEQSLLQATQKQFENAVIIGCLFHWKQAIRRRMKTVHHIPEEELAIAMTRGVLDMLTIVDPELVPGKGIKWVKREIRKRCAAEGIAYSYLKWRDFWGYFRATWLSLYSIEEWNVHGMQHDLVARTNNPLERFHRELNNAFKSHPSIVTVVSTIRKISQNYVDKLINVALGRRKPGTKKNAKTPRGKKKVKKGKQQGAQNANEFTLPVAVDLQNVDGLSDSDSEDEAPCFDELESDSNSSDSDGRETEEDDFMPDFSFEYFGDEESSSSGQVVSSNRDDQEQTTVV